MKESPLKSNDPFSNTHSSHRRPEFIFTSPHCRPLMILPPKDGKYLNCKESKMVHKCFRGAIIFRHIDKFLDGIHCDFFIYSFNKYLPEI